MLPICYVPVHVCGTGQKWKFQFHGWIDPVAFLERLNELKTSYQFSGTNLDDCKAAFKAFLYSTTTNFVKKRILGDDDNKMMNQEGTTL